MKSSIAVALILLLLVAGVGYIALRAHGRTGTSTSTSVTSLPATTTVSNYTEPWLAQWAGALAGTAPYPTNEAVVFSAIDYGGIVGAAANESGAYADLKMLYDTNASAIRIDLNYGPWLTNNATQISAYDSFIGNITSHNKTLIIADAAAEYYRQHKLSWSDFQTAWVQRVAAVAARYHPDYYVVVKEPPWYFPMLSGYPLSLATSGALNVSQWMNLTQRLVEAVKNVSPNTKVGVAVTGDMYHQQLPISLDYLVAARNVSGLDFIAFDIYTPNAWNDTKRFLNTYGSGGKQVWIAEAWSGTAPDIFNQSREQFDAQWMQTIHTYAESIHAQYLIPFYTTFFSSYQQPSGNPPASFYQNRTPVFYAFKNITTAK